MKRHDIIIDSMVNKMLTQAKADFIVEMKNISADGTNKLSDRGLSHSNGIWNEQT